MSSYDENELDDVPEVNADRISKVFYPSDVERQERALKMIRTGTRLNEMK